MNLQRIKGLISQYKKWLISPSKFDHLYLWESVEHFQKHFNLEEGDLVHNFDLSLQNSSSKRLWTMEAKFPKEMMIAFIKIDAEMVRWTFKDLYRKENSLDGRLNRFQFHCDEMYAVWKKQHPKDLHLGHYHDADHWMACVYLFLNYPDQFAPYDLSTLQNLLSYVEAKNIPQNEDPERFFKVLKVLDKFLSEDEELQDLIYARLSDKHFKGKTLIPAYECALLAK